MFVQSLLTLALSAMSAMAYSNNCEGTSSKPTASDCSTAIGNINTSYSYNDGYSIAWGNCEIKYATNGAGDNALSGQIIAHTANTVLSSCSSVHGSYGTGNCDSCHVTVTYRNTGSGK